MASGSDVATRLTDLLDKSEVVSKVRQRAKWKLFRSRLLVEERLNQRYDERFQVETARDEALDAVGVPTADVDRGNGLYRVTWTSLVRRALRRLNIDHAKYTFIDYGSGKGKAMLMAADYPFRAVVGLEFAPKLHETAVANCRTYTNPAQLCFELEPILTDVLEYAPPPGPIVCFMANPFDQATARQVFANWRERFERGDGDVRVMYLNMRTVGEMAATLDEQDWLEPVAKATQFVILAPRRRTA